MSMEDHVARLEEKLTGRVPYNAMPDDSEDQVNPNAQSNTDTGESNIFGQKSNIWAVILLAHTSMWLYADQNLMAPNLTAIADSFGFDDDERDEKLGGEVSFSFFILGGIVALTIGPLSDSVNRVNLFTFVVWLGSLPCLLTLFVSTYWQFLLLRMMTGISLGGSLPIIFSLAGDFFPPSQRSIVSAVITILLNIGTGIGQVIAGDVGAILGWRAPFAIVAVPALASATLVKLTVKEPPRGRFGHAGDPSHSEKISWRKFRDVFKIPTNCLIFIQGVFGCVPWSVINTYLCDFLHEDKGLSIQVATAIFAVFSVGCGFGMVFGGVVGQILYNKSPGLEAILMSVTTAVGMIPFFLFINKDFSGSANAGDYLLAFLGGIAGATGPIIRAVIMNVNPSNNQGTMFSVYTVADDLGRGLGPVIVSGLILTTGRVLAFNFGFGCWGICAFYLFLMLYTIPKDEEKLDLMNGRSQTSAESRSQKQTPHRDSISGLSKKSSAPQPHVEVSGPPVQFQPYEVQSDRNGQIASMVL